jgi:UTP--glucose-1-phosphate uridylyltransferase
LTVRKAVIPAAGLGTRFLPATKSLPKEMIPVLDKPMIQYVVEEAVSAGLDDVLIVLSRGKAAVEDHFDRSYELEHHLESTDKLEALEEIRQISRLAQIHYVRQGDPLGFGHAVGMAREHVGGEPFAVLVADEVVPPPGDGEPGLMESMIAIFEQKQASVVMVQETPSDEISAYGVIDPEVQEDGFIRVRTMVEKPPSEEAPSNLGSRGRYVFTPELFAALDRTTKGYGGEIQLTDGIKLLAREQPVYAYVHEGQLFDVGKKLECLEAAIELALRREDFAKPLQDYIVQLAGRFA